MPPRGNAGPHYRAPDTKHPIKIWIQKANSISWHHLLETSMSQNKHVSYTKPCAAFSFKGAAPVASQQLAQKTSSRISGFPNTQHLLHWGPVNSYSTVHSRLTMRAVCWKVDHHVKMPSQLKLNQGKAVKWLFHNPRCIEMEKMELSGNRYPIPNLYSWCYLRSSHWSEGEMHARLVRTTATKKKSRIQRGLSQCQQP